MDDWEKKLSEISVATSDYADDELPEVLGSLLHSIRESLNMDVVFVSKFADGHRKFVAADSAPDHDFIRPGMSDPLEQSWCHRIVQGRLPELIRDGKMLIARGQVPFTPLEIGTHLSVPVVLPDGSVYGTLCTFAFFVDNQIDQHDVERLRETSKLIARRLRRPGP
ncbi:MAG: GAF domain-containing protein [Hylemonella sp.]|nr:GAF domain-containing protein [Hylemonella sp.]